MPTPTLIDSNLDLSADPQARHYVKNEVVTVKFAREDGALMSREGRNTYHAGDALITGSSGDEWSVTRARFDAKYVPVAPVRPGHDGAYRNIPLPVFAKQMPQDFSIARCNGGDVIHGQGGDWLMQYAPGDYGIVAQAKFAQVYRRRDA